MTQDAGAAAGETPADASAGAPAKAPEEMDDQNAGREAGGRARPSRSEFEALLRRTEDMGDRLGMLERGRDEAAVEPKGGGDDAEAGPARATIQLTESMVEEKYDEYELPESSYTLLMTEDVLSVPFLSGILSAVVSMLCLVLALKNELDNGSGNPLGIPAGVDSTVRTAQYLGMLIGVIMEQEIPTGLEIIGKGAEQSISGGERYSMPRIMFSAIVRMTVGYTFLTCLFLTVIQETTVLGIFFDVLALEFVENIDDAVYEVSKRGFFGRKLRVATNNTHIIQGSMESRAFRKWMKRFVRFVYVLNVCLMLGLFTAVTVNQHNGAYRCKKVVVDFGNAIWEDAHVFTERGHEKKLLLYSHFNGIYEEDGRTPNGKPRYVERNKEDADKFESTVPAEIVYCDDIESWVLRHDNIRTSRHDETRENECSWLMRSPSTESFDITELAEETEWFVWSGLIQDDHKVHIECTDCDGDYNCNYNGKCNDGECSCDDGHFGYHCQFENPCKVIRSEKDTSTTLQLIENAQDEDGSSFVNVYGRPMYIIRNMRGKPYSFLRLTYPDDDDQYFHVESPGSEGVNQSGALAPHKHVHQEFYTDDDFFEVNNETAGFQQLLMNYTFVLRYTGSRWYGQMVNPELTVEGFNEDEYHAFWKNSFSGLGAEDNSTVIISAPTSDKGSPVGVDFFEMRRRNKVFETGAHDYDYSPFGVLIPLVDYEGSGFFHCNKED